MVMTLIVMPTIMLVVLPAAVGILGYLVSTQTGFALPKNDPALGKLLESVPANLRESLQNHTAAQIFVEWVLAHLFAPLFLLVPSMVASVMAADSFAGDKERKTLEALLYTPTESSELFVAKALSPWLAALAVDLAGAVAFTLVANLAGWPVLHRFILPTWTWVALALWTGPAVAGLGLGATVLISSKVRGFQEAQQLGAMVVLPLTMPVIGQVTGAMTLSLGLVLVSGLGLWLIDVLLIWIGIRTFRRDRLL